MGHRGGWSWRRQLVTHNLMEDPQPQRSLKEDLLNGMGTAVKNKVHMGPEYRNYRRSHRIERSRAVVKTGE